MNIITQPSLQATAAYYERSIGARVFRAALQGTEIVAPSLAVRFAKRLFLTPLPPKWLQRKHAWSPSWQIQSWSFENATITVYRRLSAQCEATFDGFDESKQHVLLIHGWGGSAAQMHALADEIANRGMIPVIIEAPAHGRSAGATSSLPQFARAIEYVATRLAMANVSIQGLVAHSLGASAAAFAAARTQSIQRLVLIAPPDRPRDFTHTFAQVFGLSEATRGLMQRRIEAQEAAYMDAYASQQLAPRLIAPTLVVHDENDTVNLFLGGRRWASQLPLGEMFVTQKLGHRRILRDPAVVEKISDFLSLPNYDS